MEKLVESLKHYLSDALKMSIDANSWKRQSSLPFFLTDNYYFYEVSLLGTHCLLMISRDRADTTPFGVSRESH